MPYYYCYKDFVEERENKQADKDVYLFQHVKNLVKSMPCVSDLVAAACNRQTPKAKQINKSENPAICPLLNMIVSHRTVDEMQSHKFRMRRNSDQN